MAVTSSRRLDSQLATRPSREKAGAGPEMAGSKAKPHGSVRPIRVLTLSLPCGLLKKTLGIKLLAPGVQDPI